MKNFEIFMNDHDKEMSERGFISISRLPFPEGVSMQDQYISHCIDGLAGRPKLIAGLRFEFPDGKGNYHSYYIHKDDAAEFVKRILEYKGYIPKEDIEHQK